MRAAILFEGSYLNKYGMHTIILPFQLATDTLFWISEHVCLHTYYYTYVEFAIIYVYFLSYVYFLELHLVM